MRKVKTAMVLAAGLGTRLKPLTETQPKPLIEAGGRSLLRRGLDMLAAAGVERAVINTHYLAEQLIAAVAALRADYPMELLISDEREKLLDSAGGIIKALPLLGAAPFFVLNADSFWRAPKAKNGQSAPPRRDDNWQRLAAAFAPEKQDMLLLTVPRAAALVPPPRGDFTADKSGRLRRAAAGGSQTVIYAGGMILNPKIFAGAAANTPQSLNFYFDKALAQQRLYGLNLEAQWFSIGSPAELAAADVLLRPRP